MVTSLFPYEPRSNQKVILDHIDEILNEGTNLVVESGTGSGKTICALAPCLDYAIQNNKKVVYLTRTNSQQKQVIRELRAINEKCKVLGLGLQGRNNMCSLLKTDLKIQKGTSEELSKYCAEKKEAIINGDFKKGCAWYNELRIFDMEIIENYVKNNLPTVEEFINFCEKNGVCPYEMNKLLLKKAKVVTAPYVYFFSPVICHSFLEWLNLDVSDLIVIVDETHNLPDFARDLFSCELSSQTLNLAISEAKKIGDPKIRENISISGFCQMMDEILIKIATEYVIDEDGMVPTNELEVQLMSRLTATSREVKMAIIDLLTHGEIIRERKRRNGKLPRSYIYIVGRFLNEWLSFSDEEYAKIVVGGENPKLEIYCLTPSKATMRLKECHSSIHMSGTLAPLIEYRDSIGLPETTTCISLPSPFPPENKKLLYVNDVTTKYEIISRDKEVIDKMTAHIKSVTSKFQRNTILFFPSFALIDQFSKILSNIGRDCYFEEKGMTQDELMTTVSDFKLNENAILFAVMGGRISEGIDFPRRELEIAVLIGIPYPKPTAKQKALLDFYDGHFGKGWEYSVKAPATRKLLQSIGRLYRTEDDRGVALILDSRGSQFKSEISGLTSTINPLEDMEVFFSGT